MRVLDLDGREVHAKIKGDTQSQRPVSALRLATTPPARAGEPQGKQEHNCSDCGVHDEADDAGAEVNSEAMQQPVADEGADDANGRVANETKPVAPYNLARQPSGNEPDDQNDDPPLVRQMHALGSSLRFAAQFMNIAKKLGRKQT
jgi:hypothetical protein